MFPHSDSKGAGGTRRTAGRLGEGAATCPAGGGGGGTSVPPVPEGSWAGAKDG